MKQPEADGAGTRDSTTPKLVTYSVLIGCIVFTLIYCVLLVVMVLGITGNFAPLNQSWGHALPSDSLALVDRVYIYLVPLFFAFSVNIGWLKRAMRRSPELTSRRAVRALLGIVIALPLVVCAAFLYNFARVGFYQSTSRGEVLVLLLAVIGAVWLGVLIYMAMVTGLIDNEPGLFMKRLVRNRHFLLLYTPVVVILTMSVGILIGGFRKVHAHWQLQDITRWVIGITTKAFLVALVLSSLFLLFEYFGNVGIIRSKEFLK
jgi:hypothetical protein